MRNAMSREDWSIWAGGFLLAAVIVLLFRVILHIIGLWDAPL